MTEDTIETGTTSPRRRRLPAAGLVGAGLAAGLVLAGLTAASAQTDPTPTPTATAAPGERDKAEGKGRGKGGPGKHGRAKHGLPGALHGEFTTRAPGGGFQTVAVQRGEVTAVSATSITVRSEDGFARTYAVDDGTLVNAGDEGIADVATGDRVHVTAIVADGTARAVRIVDVTKVRESRDRWAPRGPRTDPTPSPSATS